MGYVTKIEESKQKVYNQAVATKILDLINDLRLSSSDKDERRWIWELIQNAKDVAYENQPVSICVDLESKSSCLLEFRHNGRPFSIDNITFLIEQVSTKERTNKTGEKIKATGKFGTGFLTTHLLSEKVEVEGVVKEPSLPYKKFALILDRSGTEIDELIISVGDSLKMLGELDNTDKLQNFKEEDFNTNFRYFLDENGIATAEKGISDLELSLPFTLAFVPSVKSVCINSNTTYSLLPQVTIEGDDIEIYTVQKQEATEIIDFNIAVVSNGRVSIAIQIEYSDGSINIVDPNEQLPKLFCDFPLVGSEDFNLPVVVNSSWFNPTPSRNGIFISDKSGSQIVENKQLLIEARDLYFKLLDFAALNNWKNMYVLAQVSLPKPKDWISREWFTESILTPSRKKLLSTPLIDTILYGRIPIEYGEFNVKFKGATVDFPKLSKNTLLTRFWSICNNSYFILPIEEDYQQWSKIIWDDKYVTSLNSIIKLIESKGNVEKLSNALRKTKSEVVNWLNEYYALLVDEAVFIKDVSGSSIYPNQNGVFKKRDELLFEKSCIAEPLKDIAGELGKDFRERLIDTAINIELPRNNICTPEMIANEITSLIKPRLAELQRSIETKTIFKKLYLWFTQNKEEADKIFDYLYKNKHKLLDDEEIAKSIEKSSLFDQLIKEDPLLSLDRIRELLEIEKLSQELNVERVYTPDEEQKRKNFINGWKGEAYVWKVLLKRGFKVEWPNKSQVETANQITDFEGDCHFIEDKMQKYDLVIVLPGNKKSFIQVKSTSTNILRADEIAMPISVREWNFINEKTTDDAYYLARVFDVTSTPDVYFMKVDKIETV